MKIFNKIKNLIQKNQVNLADNQFFTNKTNIMKWIDKYKISCYTINDDLSVDVDGSVDIYDKNLKTIPVKFGNVIGSFYCNNNKLKNLIGSPKTVGGTFDCSNNKLRTLTGAKKIVNGNLNCCGNPLRSLFELNNCKFEGNIYFSIDENNFKTKINKK